MKMKEFRWYRLLVTGCCWLTLLAVLSWGAVACRGTGPETKGEKSGEDKPGGGNDGGGTDSNKPLPDGVKPNPDRKGPKPDKSTTPTELTIMDIQNPSSPKHVEKGASVVLKGVVVTSPTFVVSKTTGLQGFFVADGTFPTKKWGGVLIVVDGDFTESVSIGDKFDIEGAVDEFSFGTQVVARSSRGGSVTKTGTVPAADIKAVVVKPEDIPGAPTDIKAPDSSKTEAYEGVLVEIKDVEVTESADKYGLFKVTGGVAVDDNFFKGFSPKKGDKIKFIRGIIYYSFDIFRLLPRSSKDVDGGVPQCTDDKGCGTGRECKNEQCVAYTCAEDKDCKKTGEVCNAALKRCEMPRKTVTIMDIQNAASANYIAKGNPVELKGVIITSGTFDVSKNLKGFFVSDPSFPKAWGGVMVTISKDWTETIEIGDEIDLVGRTGEYYDNTQVTVDTSKDGKITKTGKNLKDKIAAINITLADLPPKPADPKKANDSKAEAFEGMLVELKDVTVTAAVDAKSHDQWKIDGGLIIGPAFFKATPTVGDKFKVLRGLVQFSFGEFKIHPRSAADLQK